MVGKELDISNKVYGRLTAISRSLKKSKGTDIRWLFICECGNKKILNKYQVISGRTVSCGCYYEKVRGMGNFKHGLSYTSTYSSWHGMLQRCYNPNSAAAKWYSKKGIEVSEDWKSFNNFYRDMGEKPSPNHSIERIDGSKGYSKNNCKWATIQEQNNNKSNNVYVTIDNEKMTLSSACRKLSINRSTVTSRIRRGMTPQQAISL